MTIGVIGGGIAGVAMASALEAGQHDFFLIEKSDILGGNARTLKWDQFLFDTGAHRFHHQIDDVTTWVQKLLGDDLKLIEVPSAIFWNGRYIDFPISPINLLLNSGVISSIRGISSFLKAKLMDRGHAPQNFEEMAISRYGKYWAKHFLLDYSEKLWGLPCHLLSTEISGKRLKGLTLKTVIHELLGGKNKKTAHLDGSFYYPRFGIGMLTEELVKTIPENKINLHASVEEIHTQDGLIKAIKTNSEFKEVNALVSTIPLGLLTSKLIPPAPENILNAAKSLRYRSLYLVLIKINRPQIGKWGSLYFPQATHIFTRAYEPKNRSPEMAPKDCSSLVLEIPCFLESNHNLDEIKELAITQFASTKIISRDEIIESKIIAMENAYPVLSLEDEERKKQIEDYLSNYPNLYRIGRSGRFVYSHIHDILLEAKELCAQLVAR